MPLLRTTTTALAAVLLAACLTTTVEAAASLPPDLTPHDGSAVGFDPTTFDTTVPANHRPCFIERDQWNSALDGPQPRCG